MLDLHAFMSVMYFFYADSMPLLYPFIRFFHRFVYQFAVRYHR